MVVYILQFFIATILINFPHCSLSKHVSKRSTSVNGNTRSSIISNQIININSSQDIVFPWENLITPAPAFVSILGLLMVFCSREDFPINRIPPKYIRHPTSFRSTLTQISSDSLTYFTAVFKNLDQMRLNMILIPPAVKSASKIMMDASPNLIKNLLPDAVGNIKDIAQKCAMLLVETENEYNDVILLLSEILGNMEPSHSSSAAENKLLSNTNENLKHFQSEIGVHVKMYQDAYDKAQQEIPIRWISIAQDFVRSMISMVHIIPGVFGIGKDGLTSFYQIGKQSSGNFQAVNLLVIMSQFADQIVMLQDKSVEMFNNESGSVQIPLEMFRALRVAFDVIEGLINSSTGKTGEKSLKIIQRAKQICKKLLDLQLNLKPSEQAKTNILSEIGSLYEITKSVVVAAAYSSKGMSLLSYNQSISKSMSTVTVDHEKFKAYILLELLHDFQMHADKEFGRVLKFQGEIKNFMKYMAMQDFEIRNINILVKVIKEMIIILTKFSEQFSTFIQYCFMLSTQVEIALNQAVVPYVKLTEMAQNVTDSNQHFERDRQFFMEILAQQFVGMQTTALFLYSLSDVYDSISKNFVNPRLAGISGLLQTSSASERQGKKQELTNENDEIQNKIQQIFGEKRRPYKRLAQQKIDDINSYVQKLGGPSMKDKEAVRKGMTAMKREKISNTTNPFDFD